jgi:hypothetical protein
MQPFVETVHRLLAPLGFRRRGLRWNRNVGQFVDVVTLQQSKGLDHVWVNLGVLDPEIYERLWAKPPEPFVDEADSTVRTRLGRLIDGRDGWWALDDPAAPADVVHQLEDDGLPFHERMHSRSAMEEFLGTTPGASVTPPEVMYLVILKASRQDLAGACSTLEPFRRRTLGGWKERADKLATEYGCDERPTSVN